MTDPNFASILDEAPTEINRPKPIPSGTYICVVNKWETGESSKKKTPYVRFTLTPIAAEEDVSEDDLADAGDLEGKQLRTDFYLTPDSIYRLSEFHEHCGLDISEELSHRMRNDAVVNSQVKVHVKHRASEDGSRIFAEVDRTAAVE